MKENKTKEFLSQISRFFRRGKRKESINPKSFLELINREPINGNAHLKVAEIYQKQGEKQNARSEYLRAAEIFCDEGQYHKGLAIYTKVLKQEPELEFVNLKLADVYRNMGFVAQAFKQYQKLYCIYNDAGVKDKALEMISFMADLDPQKFTLGEIKNLGPQGFEKFKGHELNKKITKINLDRPLEENKRSFFDLAAMLETTNPAELGESKSITMEESYRFKSISDPAF